MRVEPVKFESGTTVIYTSTYVSLCRECSTMVDQGRVVTSIPSQYTLKTLYGNSSSVQNFPTPYGKRERRRTDRPSIRTSHLEVGSMVWSSLFNI